MYRRIILTLFLSVIWSVMPAQEVQALKLITLRGEGAFNDIKRRTAENMVVVVKNQIDQPVAGAKVVFTLPFSGAGGTFDRNERTYTATSGADGRATAGTMRPNSIEGRFNIRVSATYSGKEASAVISQTNTLAGSHPDQSGHGKLFLVLALLGGAGAGVGLAVGRGGSSAPPPVVPTSLTAGAISVGGPR
jgi:hypothetical protein